MPVTKINEEASHENENTSSNYLVFKTKQEFVDHVKTHLKEYEDKIHNLEKENKELKVKDIEIENWKSKVDIFTNHILKKYNVEDIELKKDGFDFSNYDNLEKSIIKQLEKNKINYSRSETITDTKKINKEPKIYL